MQIFLRVQRSGGKKSRLGVRLSLHIFWPRSGRKWSYKNQNFIQDFLGEGRERNIPWREVLLPLCTEID